MIELENPGRFAGLGIPNKQLGSIAAHLATAQEHVFEQDGGPQKALEWLWGSLRTRLETDQAFLLYNAAMRNFTITPVEYAESGYDSCQSHRQLSKIVSELVLLGGLLYEGALIGLDMSLVDAQKLVDSHLDIAPDEAARLAEFTKHHGMQQDFIFPGVTPSSPTGPSLEDMAYATLAGRPKTSVRTLTGVGGLRYDRDWNHVTDLSTFAELKITEDKRYYPGLGIFYFLMTYGADNLPAIQALRTSQPEVYFAIKRLETCVKNIQHEDYEGVSILCTTYLPAWSELKTVIEFTDEDMPDLSGDFHSPSYEFAALVGLFSQAFSPSQAIQGLDNIKHALQKCWSFNSTIHLPWTAELADLSNGLMGRITNQVGDYAMRYGVGHNGKSLEVIEYYFGDQRRFPYGLAGKTAAVLKFYTASDCFSGSATEIILHSRHPFWKKVAQVGFLKAALEELHDPKTTTL